MWMIPLILGAWLFTRKTSDVAQDGYTKEQLKIMAKVRAEASRQGVPVDLALATADLESGFTNLQNHAGGQSFGPMQVNVVNLKPGETLAQLQNIDFNIRRGIEIIKRNLKKAGGNTYKARILYFCGPGLCGGKPPQKLTDRWNQAIIKWRVAAFYPGFTS